MVNICSVVEFTRQSFIMLYQVLQLIARTKLRLMLFNKLQFYFELALFIIPLHKSSENLLNFHNTFRNSTNVTLLGDKTYFEVVDDFLKNGHRLSKPELCPKHIYDIMLRCWHEKHWFRPSFSKLKILLKVRIVQKVFNHHVTSQKQNTPIIVKEIDPNCVSGSLK